MSRREFSSDLYQIKKFALNSKEMQPLKQGTKWAPKKEGKLEKCGKNKNTNN
jgi:hypothetical protein